MQKQIQFKVKGMKRDLSVSAFNPEYAYENKNIRIMPTDESTLLSIINEKGNKQVSISGVGTHLKGIPIGQSLINNELVIFTAGTDDYRLADITPDIFEVSDIFPCDILIDDLIGAEDTTDDITPNLESVDDITIIDCPYKLDIDIDSMLDDRIYKLWFNNGTLTGKRLFRGQLNFNYKNPIEAISFYENSDIRKVYWTDGLNQPRVINVAAATSVVNSWEENSFNFVRTLKLREEITIKRNIVASGSFGTGVIQYAFTYFDKYGQESNIFYTSPLYYISYNNRGASQEDKVSNSFDIEIANADKTFDYIRIYSIHRTSLNATPTVRRVIDLASPTGASTYTVEEHESYRINLPSDKITMYLRSGSKENTLDYYTPGFQSETLKSWSFDTDTYSRIYFNNRNFLLLPSGQTVSIMIQYSNRATIILGNGKMTLYDYDNAKISYTDNGVGGDIVDPTELLYIGGEEVVFGTMTQKDNTLFLGDITLKRKLLDSTIRNYFKRKSITFSTYVKSIDLPLSIMLHSRENDWNVKGVVFFMPRVFLTGSDANFELALRKFKKMVEKSAVLSELRKRQQYEKPSVKDKKKRLAARKRLMKKNRKMQFAR